MKILLTGSAGFIGFHTAKRLLDEGYEVIGLDNINDYYDPSLKYSRLSETGINITDIKDNKPAQSVSNNNYTFYSIGLENKEYLNKVFETHRPEIVINLAAQAGIRYSLANPDAYIQSNVVGFANILECCRNYPVQHLVFASSSSVYGLNDEIPFSTNQNVDHPISLYAATKKSNELMAHTYSHLFNIPVTGLRFFTVYGPWGRPDMAPMLFTDAILKHQTLKLFNYGNMLRDFTYIDDIVEGIVRVMTKQPVINNDWKTSGGNISSSSAAYKIYNIGNNAPAKLLEFVSLIEKELGIEAKKELLPIQPGDVVSTYADIEDLTSDTGYKPSTTLSEGIHKFINWYKLYFGVS